MVWFGLGWNQCAWLYSLINWLSWLSPTVELIGTFNLPPTQRSSPPMEFVEGTLPVQLKIYIQYRAGKDQWVKSKSEHCSSMNFKLYASQLVLSYKVSSCYRFQPGFAGSLFWTLQAWHWDCLSVLWAKKWHLPLDNPWFQAQDFFLYSAVTAQDQPIIRGQEFRDFLCLLEVQEHD